MRNSGQALIGKSAEFGERWGNRELQQCNRHECDTWKREGRAVNGKAQTIFATILIALTGWIVVDLRHLRSYVSSEFTDLRERMARLEGRVDTRVILF